MRSPNVVYGGRTFNPSEVLERHNFKAIGLGDVHAQPYSPITRSSRQREDAVFLYDRTSRSRDVLGFRSDTHAIESWTWSGDVLVKGGWRST